MKSRDFCYWLQGYFELTGETELSPKQLDTVKKHLAMVFKHEIDPSFPDNKVLQKIHSGTDKVEVPVLMNC